MRQAYVEGYLQPKETKTSDPNWWRKAVWTTDWLAARNMNEIRKMRHELNCALLDYFTNENALDLHWEQAMKLQNLVQKDIMPWRESIDANMARSEIHEMVDKWKTIYGDPDDPEVAERIRKTAEYLMTQAANAMPGGK